MADAEWCSVCGRTRTSETQADGTRVEGKWQTKYIAVAAVGICDECREAPPKERAARAENSAQQFELDLRDRVERTRQLPNGMACADCRRFPKCEQSFGARPTSLVCDWSVPSSFRAK